MTFWRLVTRGIRFYWRNHIGLMLCVAISTATILSALVVGDSVRYSLKKIAISKIGRIHLALTSQDRFFRDELAKELNSQFVSALLLNGIAINTENRSRANNIQIIGVDDDFWKLGDINTTIGENNAIINERLAKHLDIKSGDEILIKIRKTSLLPLDAPLSIDSDLSVSIRVIIQRIMPDLSIGGFSLQSNQIIPFNVFLPIKIIQDKVDLEGKANLILIDRADLDVDSADKLLKEHWQLEDIGLEISQLSELGMIQLSSKRIFIDQPIEDVANEISSESIGVLTYFANEIRHKNLSTPYSMITAIDPKAIMLDDGSILKDDEIVINQWLADDINAKVGDMIKLSYFVFDNQRRLTEKSTEFRIKSIVSMKGIFADKTFMPEFPGLANVENSRDWEPGIPIDLSKIRDKDEDYWHKYRGTPKGFITLKAGQELWRNRFGNLTAIRYPSNINVKEIDKSIREKLNPKLVGLYFQPIREKLLLSSKPTTDFGQLFLGLSIFLIFSSCLLAGLVFVFGVQQRREEIGTLLAIGFRSGQIKRLFLSEGLIIAIFGGVLGIALGIVYTKSVIFALSTIWQDAVNSANLYYHAETSTLFIGFFIGIIISILTIWLTLRRQFVYTAKELLSSDFSSEIGFANPLKRKISLWIAIVAFIMSMILVLISFYDRGRHATGIFFGVGGLMLIGFFALSNFMLLSLARSKDTGQFTINMLGFRNTTRRKGRSLAIISLLACGSFLIISIGANRQNAMINYDKRSSGTGGFAFYAETTLPILHNLNDEDKRIKFGINETSAKFVQFRVREGDDASCLNLNRVQTPRILGVDPAELQKRDAFKFVKSISKDGFGMLNDKSSDDRVINAICDDATLTWSLGLSVGDMTTNVDERGQPFKIKIVGSLSNSILQGVFIISEQDFIRLFPSESGYRVFLIDADFENMADTSKKISQAFQDFGIELTPAYVRLAEFSAVQNTYLSIFQMLGGLALILGSVGLGLVVLRNILERRRELALMRAVGYSKKLIQRLLINEHWALLLVGEFFGAVTGLISVLPAIAIQRANVPYVSLILTLIAVFFSGLIWIWLATKLAGQGNLLSALRDE